jgi:hypothetical protein
MNGVKIAAVLLIVGGVLGLAYGGFSYTKETHQAKIGPIELSVNEKQTVNVPVWAGVGAIVIGGALLAGGRRSHVKLAETDGGRECGVVRPAPHRFTPVDVSRWRPSRRESSC